MNEWEIIKLLKDSFKSEIEVPIGDDCAVIKQGDSYLIITKDLMVENTHFTLKNYPLDYLGEKLVNSNLSDMAAMGALPSYALLGLSIKEKLGDEDIKLLLDGIKRKLREHKVFLIGGDIVKSERLSLSLTILGETKRYILRKGAKVGDIIYLSGEIGFSKAGLFEFLNKGKVENKEAEKRFLRGNNRLDLVDFFQSQPIDAMIDTSDGFYQDLNHILEESKVGAEIYLEKFPRITYLEKIAKESGLDYFDFIINSGEEYELIVVAPEEDKVFIEKGFLKIGKIVEGEGIHFYYNKEEKQIKNLSYTHNI